MTNDSLSPDKRSAQRNGAHPVIIGSFLGMVVHQVGSHSSSENRKPMSERVFPSLPGAGIVSQKRLLKRRVTRIILPISNFVSASNFIGGNTGSKRTAPSSSDGAFMTPNGIVTS